MLIDEYGCVHVCSNACVSPARHGCPEWLHLTVGIVKQCAAHSIRFSEKDAILIDDDITDINRFEYACSEGEAEEFAAFVRIERQ